MGVPFTPYITLRSHTLGVPPIFPRGSFWGPKHPFVGTPPRSENDPFFLYNIIVYRFLVLKNDHFFESKQHGNELSGTPQKVTHLDHFGTH